MKNITRDIAFKIEEKFIESLSLEQKELYDLYVFMFVASYSEDEIYNTPRLIKEAYEVLGRVQPSAS